MAAEANGAIRKAVDELYVLSSSEEVRAEYERRQKALMDYNTYMEDHFLAGIKEGEIKGRKEGQKLRDEEILSLIRQGYMLKQLEKSLSQHLNQLLITKAVACRKEHYNGRVSTSSAPANPESVSCQSGRRSIAVVVASTDSTTAFHLQDSSVAELLKLAHKCYVLLVTSELPICLALFKPTSGLKN